MRGFALVSTDTGHKSHRGGFDFGFEKDQQAYLDFAYLANAQVAGIAKQIIARITASLHISIFLAARRAAAKG